MRLKRILGMSPQEIAFRGRQQMFKTLERATVVVPDTEQQRKLAEALARQIQVNAALNFFAGASDASVPDLVAQHCGVERLAIIASADGICRGEFQILGYGKLSFRPRQEPSTRAGSLLPIDWHLDPVSGRRSPVLHWSRIDPLDPEQAGDSKVVWELNRHQWMLDLGQAWQYTRDERYGIVFSQLLNDWIANNPVGVGINWTSALEVSMRTISWCWALVLFRGCDALTPALASEMRSGIRAHGLYVERYVSRYFSPNTHLTGEALGLFYIGVLFPEMKEASRWRSLGKKILEQEIDRQVFADGVYFEQSTCYQYYTIEIYLQFLLLAQRNRIAVSVAVRDGLSRLLEYALALRRPDGRLPAIGDGDGGWLLPLVRRQPGDFRGLFSAASALLRRNDFAWAAGYPEPSGDALDATSQSRGKLIGLSPEQLTPELLWLLGPLGRFAFLALDPQPPPVRQLQLFPHGGYAVMRNHTGHDGHQLIFDIGPLGASGSAGHGHADLLSIQCSVFGEPMLIDAGTGCYTGNQKLRNYFRSTSAHSTVKVDDREQAEPAGAFSWVGTHPTARLLQHCSRQNCVWVDASLVDRQRPEHSVTHRRRVAFINKHYWIIVDDISTSSTELDLHNVTVNFQFAALPVTADGDGWVRARGRQQGGLLLRAFSNSALESSIDCGALDPRSGWMSPKYGQSLPAPAVHWRTASRLPLRIITLLYPILDADALAPRVTVQLQGSTSRLALTAEVRDEIEIVERDIRVAF